jgi:uncharacterized protein (TIGR02391 family)
MRALTWHGNIRCHTVPDPKIEHGRDAIIKVTACAICGSDLHLFDSVMPTMEKGDVLGHETMGEVVEVGSENNKLKVGDRVVVPFTISCGECFVCKKGFFSGCERSNPNHTIAEKLWGHSPAGLFGYSHMLGGYVGDQTEYLRVPCADVGPIKVPQGLSDEQVLFLSDIFPTGFMASDFCNLKGGETTSQSPEIFQKPRYIRGSQRRSGPHFFALSLIRPLFHTMRAVEIYVREAGGYTDGDLGTTLMRQAFHEDDGPLIDKTVEKSERQARSALFSAAIGSYKNPHSHRDVDIDNADEALEIVLLANHLLRIVDRRVAARGQL